jgi:hypothetical protein
VQLSVRLNYEITFVKCESDGTRSLMFNLYKIHTRTTIKQKHNAKYTTDTFSFILAGVTRRNGIYIISHVTTP